MKKKIIMALLIIISLAIGFIIAKLIIKPEEKIIEIEVEKVITLEKEIFIETPLILQERQLIEVNSLTEVDEMIEACGRRLNSAIKFAEAAEELGYNKILLLAEREISQAEEDLIYYETIREEYLPETYDVEDEYEYIQDSDVVMLAKTIFNEARGIYSQTEQACIIWTVLNRIDAGWYSSVYEALTSPEQFAYEYYTPTVDDYGRDLIELAADVLMRWYSEKEGNTNVGRVLPNNYYWYAGDGYHNYFRDAYIGGNTWDYSWGTPYST